MSVIDDLKVQVAIMEMDQNDIQGYFDPIIKNIKEVSEIGKAAIGIGELDIKQKEELFRQTIRMLHADTQKLKNYMKELEIRKKLGISNKDILKNVDELRKKTIAIYLASRDWGNTLPEINDDYLKQLNIASDLLEKFGEVEKKVESVGDKLRRWGMANMARAYDTLTTADGLIAIFAKSIIGLLHLQERWLTQNYGLYGSVNKVTDTVTDAAIASGVLREEAYKTADALMKVAIAKDSLYDLTIVVADATKELGMSDEVASRYAKNMQMAGYTIGQTAEQFKNLKRVAQNFGVTGAQLDTMVTKLNNRFFTMQSRLGKPGFEKYQQQMAYLGGIAQKVGADFGQMIDMIDQLNEDRMQYVILLQGTDWLNEKDSAKLFQAMVDNAEGALKDIGRFPAAIQAEYAKDMYGISLEQLNAMKRMKDEGMDLTHMTMGQLDDEMRRMQSPMYAFTKTLEDIGTGLYTLMWPIIEILGWLAHLGKWFSELPGWIKKSTAVLFWALIFGSVLMKSFGVQAMIAGRAVIGLGSLLVSLGIKVWEVTMKFPLLNKAMTSVGGAFSRFGTWVMSYVTKLGIFSKAQTVATAATAESAATTSATLPKFGEAIGKFGKAIAPAILPILGLAGAFVLITVGLAILAKTFTGWDMIAKTAVAAGLALVVFAGLAWIAVNIIGSAAVAGVPALIVAGVLIAVAFAMWILAKAADVFVGAIEKLIKLDFSGFADNMWGFALGMVYMNAAFAVAILTAAFAIVAIPAMIAIAIALWLFFSLIKPIAPVMALAIPVFAMFAIAMTSLAEGMAILVGAKWFRFPIAAAGVGLGLRNLFSGINHPGIKNLPIITKDFQRAMQELRYGMDWIVGSDHSKFKTAGANVGSGLNDLFGGVNVEGLEDLPVITKNFQRAMQEMRYGIDWLIGSDHTKFKTASANVGAGLNSIFSAMDSDGVKNLPIITKDFQRAMQELRYGTDWVAGINYDKFDTAAEKVGDGLNKIFSALSKSSELNNLMEILEKAPELDNFIKIGQAFDQLAASIDRLKQSDLSNVSANIERNIATINASINKAKTAIANYEELEGTKVVEHERIISPNIGDEANSRNTQSRELISRLDALIKATSGVNDSINSKGEGSSLQKIADVVLEYLPQLAENNDSGLGPKSTTWSYK